jgi:hypothetical protein
VNRWFDRAPTSVAEGPPVSQLPTVTTSQTSLTAVRDKRRRSSVPAANNQGSADWEEVLRHVKAEQRFRNERFNNRISFLVTPSDVTALQAGPGDLRPPGSITVNIIREERIQITHRRIDSAGQHVSQRCPRCSFFHEINTVEPNGTVLAVPPLSKKDICVSLFLFLLLPFMLLFFGSRVSSQV